MTITTLPRFKCPNDFLDNDNIVTRFMPRHKPSLARIDNLGNIGFEPLHKQARKQLIKGITQANWAKLRDSFQMCYLGNKN